MTIVSYNIESVNSISCDVIKIDLIKIDLIKIDLIIKQDWRMANDISLSIFQKLNILLKNSGFYNYFKRFYK